MIELSCPCGAVLRAGEERAGQRCRCPACGASHVFPGATVVAPGDPGVQELPPRSPSARPRSSCPTCGAKLSGDALLCVACGTELATGRRLSGGARDLVPREERIAHLEEQDRRSLGELIVGALLRPASTLETIRFQLSFPGTLLAMVLFWLATIAALGALDAIRLARTAPRPVIAAGMGVRTLTVEVAGKTLHLTLDPYPLREGAPAQVRLRADQGPPQAPLTIALVPRGAMVTPAMERPIGYDKPVSLTVPAAQNASLYLRYHPTNLPPAIVLDLPLDVLQATSPVQGTRQMLIGVLIQLARAVGALVVWAALLGLGGLCFTGRSELRSLVAVLAFLQGVTHLLWLPVLPFYPDLGHSVLLVEYALLLWTAVLYFFAVHGLYDVDARAACVLVLFSGGLVQTGLFYAQAPR